MIPFGSLNESQRKQTYGPIEEWHWQRMLSEGGDTLHIKYLRHLLQAAQRALRAGLYDRVDNEQQELGEAISELLHRLPHDQDLWRRQGVFHLVESINERKTHVTLKVHPFWNEGSTPEKGGERYAKEEDRS